MNYQEVKNILISRLDEADRGDRGWFIITRVHTSVNWIKGITEYLLSKGEYQSITLSNSDYQKISNIVGIRSTNPGIQLRRHHLLVMDKPLQLIDRIISNSWQKGIKLTEKGTELAITDDPSETLENVLRDIRFAMEPWSPPQRVHEYHEFNIPVYSVTLQILDACDGFIDRNEFDLFVSRIRTEDEILGTVELIHAFRNLTNDQKNSLLREVENRIPNDKSYQNWRDISLHTFSLFSLGTSMIRDGQYLLKSDKWASEFINPIATKKRQRKSKTGDVAQIERELRIPKPPETEILLIPPTAQVTNDGTDGESFVAKVLRSQGWKIAFYTNRRGYGFDLWARHDKMAMLVEVKSSLGKIGSITLTDTEYRAAQENGDNYVLAIVEELNTDHPILKMIQNPLRNLEITERETTTYTIPRSGWINL